MTMSALLYDIRRPGSRLLIVTPQGSRATLHDAGSFRDMILEEIGNGCRILIINFEKVDFIDSTFMGALVVGWKKITSLNGSLVLTNLNDKMKDTFNLTQLDKKLTIAETVAQALLLFKAKE